MFRLFTVLRQIAVTDSMELYSHVVIQYMFKIPFRFPAVTLSYN